MTSKPNDYRASLWPLPSARTAESGSERRLGMEIEFTGMEMDAIAETIVDCFGGRIERQSDYEYQVTDTPFGTFGVELDSAYIKKLGRDREQAGAGNDFEELTESIVGLVAKQLVPFEIVAPPIAL
ncbi:MAG: amidoligase family protein, partial [Spongiibacter marinus]